MTRNKVKSEYARAEALLCEAADILGEIVNDMGTWMDERSDAWQESDKGVSYEAMMSEIENHQIGVREAADFEVEFDD